jgi:hypothetical protein
MALNAFTFTGGGNVSITGTPQAVQVVGPTIVVSNIGQNTVYGSLGGSASTTLNPGLYLSGQPLGGTGGGNTGTGVGGFAVLPGQSLPVSVSGQSWLWMQTLQGLGSVNIANGT